MNLSPVFQVVPKSQFLCFRSVRNVINLYYVLLITDEALAMLDADEEVFEQENVLRQVL